MYVFFFEPLINYFVFTVAFDFIIIMYFKAIKVACFDKKLNISHFGAKGSSEKIDVLQGSSLYKRLRKTGLGD